MNSTKIVVETIVLFLFGLMLVNARPNLNRELDDLKLNYLTERLEDYFPELVDVTRAGIERCFESIDNPKSSYSVLFQPIATIHDLLVEYYSHFTGIKVSTEGVTNILRNTKIILKHVIKCSGFLKSPKLDSKSAILFKVGFTSMSSANFRQFSGVRPFNLKLANNSSNVLGSYMTYGNCDTAEEKAPDSLDFRNKYPELLKVRNQGLCKACWAFTMIGVVEGANLMKKKKNWGPLAPQFLIDFNTENSGCDSGLGEKAASFIQEEGLPMEATYPYCAKKTNRKKPQTATKIKSYCVLKNNITENLRKSLLNKYGPMWFTMKAGDETFTNYKTGIYHGHGSCGGVFTWHSLLLVGYTPSAWILRNSWSENWGQNGFIQVARNENTCECDTECGYVVV